MVKGKFGKTSKAIIKEVTLYLLKVKFDFIKDDQVHDNELYEAERLRGISLYIKYINHTFNV